MRSIHSRHDRPRVVMLLENNPYPQDVRVHDEAESLAAAGYTVEVIAPWAPGQPPKERIGAVEVRRFRVFRPQTLSVKGFMLEYLVALPVLHRHALRALLGGADVLHLHNPPDLLFPAGAIYRLAGRRVVFDHHDLFPEMVRVKTRSRRLEAAARIAERLTYAVADHVLATNESYAEIARLRGKKSSHEVTIVRNAPPDSWLERPLCEPAKPPDDGLLRLGYLGELSDHDGVDSLIRLLARIRRRGLDPHLTIIGDGDARPRLEHAAELEGMADRVTFTGWIRHDAVPEMLGRVDVCVDPAPASEYNDRSTMTKIAEYLCVGQPIVAYDLTETRRTAGDAAVLVEPGDEAGFADAVIALARDPGRRRLRSALARERARSLSWSHSERALLDAYGRMIGESPLPVRRGRYAWAEAHDDRPLAEAGARATIEI